MAACRNRSMEAVEQGASNAASLAGAPDAPDRHQQGCEQSCHSEPGRARTPCAPSSVSDDLPDLITVLGGQRTARPYHHRNGDSNFSLELASFFAADDSHSLSTPVNVNTEPSKAKRTILL